MRFTTFHFIFSFLLFSSIGISAVSLTEVYCSHLAQDNWGTWESLEENLNSKTSLSIADESKKSSYDACIKFNHINFEKAELIFNSKQSVQSSLTYYADIESRPLAAVTEDIISVIPGLEIEISEQMNSGFEHLMRTEIQVRKAKYDAMWQEFISSLKIQYNHTLETASL